MFHGILHGTFVLPEAEGGPRLGRMKACLRVALVLAAAVTIPACGSGDTFVLHVLPVPTSGTILYVGPGNVLINVSPAKANEIVSAIGLKNLQPSEDLLALDYDSVTGTLYGLGNSKRLYQIDPQTGDCSQVGPVVA